MKTRILIADDHAILRQGIRKVIADRIPDCEIGEAEDAASALRELHRHPWEVLILDINMPGRNGFEVLAEARGHFPNLAILVFSSMPEEEMGLRAIKAGAAGYLYKQSAPDVLFQAVDTVRKGGQYFSNVVAQQMVADLQRGTDQPRAAALSDREVEVCCLAAKGKSVKEIAGELKLSPKTISTFRTRAFEKIAVKIDVELARVFREQGLI
jgi:two-component system invasion response regulator UvrY